VQIFIISLSPIFKVNDGSTREESDNFQCNCNSANCRGRVTSRDSELPDVQARLGDFFSPFVKDKLSGNSNQVSS